LYTFSNLDWVYEGFYIQNSLNYFSTAKTKVIPSWIADFLTPISLAHWIMQDGSRQKKQGINIATNSFSHTECLFLAELLTKNFNLKTSVIKTGTLDQWRISIWKQSMDDLVDIVPSMHYKFEGYLPLKQK